MFLLPASVHGQGCVGSGHLPGAESPCSPSVLPLITTWLSGKVMMDGGQRGRELESSGVRDASLHQCPVRASRSDTQYKCLKERRNSSNHIGFPGATPCLKDLALFSPLGLIWGLNSRGPDSLWTILAPPLTSCWMWANELTSTSPV